MDIGVLISVDIKKIENHLSILQNELKEIIILIEILTTIYQMTDNSNVILRQIQSMKKEKECIQQRLNILENSIDKFSKVKMYMSNELDEAIEILKYSNSSK